MAKKRMRGSNSSEAQTTSESSSPSKRGTNLSNERKTEILKMFNRMDPNGNGYVEQHEFEDYMINNDVSLGRN